MSWNKRAASSAALLVLGPAIASAAALAAVFIVASFVPTAALAAPLAAVSGTSSPPSQAGDPAAPQGWLGVSLGEDPAPQSQDATNPDDSAAPGGVSVLAVV